MRSTLWAQNGRNDTHIVHVYEPRSAAPRCNEEDSRFKLPHRPPVRVCLFLSPRSLLIISLASTVASRRIVPLAEIPTVGPAATGRLRSEKGHAWKVMCQGRCESKSSVSRGGQLCVIKKKKKSAWEKGEKKDHKGEAS